MNQYSIAYPQDLRVRGPIAPVEQVLLRPQFIHRSFGQLSFRQEKARLCPHRHFNIVAEGVPCGSQWHTCEAAIISPNRSGRWLKCITMRFLQFVSFQGKCIVLAYNEMNTRTHVSRHSSLFLFSSLFGPINVRCDLLFVHITLITLCIRKIDD